MNSRVSAFINNHEEEIDSNDFFSVFTAAHSELSNSDCTSLIEDLKQVFDADFIEKQREASLRFILTMACDDLDPSSTYTYAELFKDLLGYNAVGLSYTEFCEYLAENQAEFDIEIHQNSMMNVARIRKKR